MTTTTLAARPDARARLLLIDVEGLGARLARARAMAGLTVTELAARAGMEAANVVGFESSLAFPTVGAVRRLADACGCPAVDLLFPGRA